MCKNSDKKLAIYESTKLIEPPDQGNPGNFPISFILVD